MKIYYWFAFCLIAIFGVAVLVLDERSESCISRNSIVFGDFVVTSEPPGLPCLGVYTKINNVDLLPSVDPPVKIVGVSGDYLLAEKVFSDPDEWDQTRGLVKPLVEVGSASAYFMIPQDGNKKIRWFSDSRFKIEITDRVGDRDAVKIGEPRYFPESER